MVLVPGLVARLALASAPALALVLVPVLALVLVPVWALVWAPMSVLVWAVVVWGAPSSTNPNVLHHLANRHLCKAHNSPHNIHQPIHK